MTSQTSPNLPEHLTDVPPGTRWSVQMNIEGSSLATSAKVLEFEIFQDAYGETQKDLDTLYESYERQSIFGVVVNHDDNVVVGEFRFILGTFWNTSCFQDFEKIWGITKSEFLRWYKVSPSTKFVEVGTMGVSTTSQGRYGLAPVELISGALLQVIDYFDIDYWIGILDSRAKIIIEFITGIPLGTACDRNGTKFLGSELSHPIVFDNLRIPKEVKPTKDFEAVWHFKQPSFGTVYHTGLEALPNYF